MTTRKMYRYVLFTDLDGTLLDSDTYSFREALHYLETLKKAGVPVVFCSAKTRAEQEYYRHELRIDDPFIVENGNAVFIEEGYFDFRYPYNRKINGYLVLEYGMPYEHVREKLAAVRSESGIEMVGYGDMSVREVSALTGLKNEEADRAKSREYEETITSPLDEVRARELRSALQSTGLTLSRGGRFYSVSAPTDKGRAVRALALLFRRAYGSIRTVGIGDSWNDRSMLSAVDVAFLVQKPGGFWEDIEVSRLRKIEGVGPRAWRGIAERLLDG